MFSYIGGSLHRLSLRFFSLVIVVLSVCIAVFLFMDIVGAQTADTLADLDDTVTEQDFSLEEVEAPGAFHVFKRFGRGVKEAFTFDPLKKAEVKLEHANIELLEAKKAAESGAFDPKALERFEGKLRDIREEATRFEDTDATETFFDKVLDNQIKQQKVLDSIEDVALKDASKSSAARVFDTVKSVQERSASHVGEVIGRGDPRELSERFDRVLNLQRGSEFKDIKNLEVLKRVEAHVPEEAKEAIDQAQDRAFKRVATHFAREGKQAGEAFETYIEDIDGDETRFIEVLDSLKGDLLALNPDLPPEIVQKFERAKDIAAQRFQHKIEDFGESFDKDFQKRAQDRIFRRFRVGDGEGPDVEELRAIEEIRQRVHFEDEALQEEIEQHHKEALNQFKQAFSDPTSNEQAKRFEALSRKMAENPDPTTFRLLQELEDEVRTDPKKAAFLEKIDREAKKQFAEQAQEHGDDFFEHIASTNPQDIEIFKQLQQDFVRNPDEFFDGDGFGGGQFDSRFGPPPGFERFFDRAIDTHTEHIQDHLAEIDDPRIFEQFQHKFNDFDFIPPEFLHFEQGFDDKREFFENIDKEEFEFHRQNDDERRKIEERFFQKFEDPNLSDEERRALEEEFNSAQRLLDARGNEERRRFFEKRLELDPFCDERCLEEEKRTFERQLDFERQEREDFEEFHRIEKELHDFRDEQFRDQFEPGLHEDGDFFPPGEGPDGFGPPPFEGDGDPRFGHEEFDNAPFPIDGLTPEEIERKKAEFRFEEHGDEDRFREDIRFEDEAGKFRQEVRFDDDEFLEKKRFEQKKEDDFRRDNFDRPPPVDETFFEEGREEFKDDFRDDFHGEPDVHDDHFEPPPQAFREHTQEDHFRNEPHHFEQRDRFDHDREAFQDKPDHFDERHDQEFHRPPEGEPHREPERFDRPPQDDFRPSDEHRGPPEGNFFEPPQHDGPPGGDFHIQQIRETRGITDQLSSLMELTPFLHFVREGFFITVEAAGDVFWQ